MRTQICCLLFAALGVTMLQAGCRMLAGLGDLTFDLPDGGGTGGTTTTTSSSGGGGTGDHMDGGPDGDAGHDGDAGDAGDAEAGCAPSGYICGDSVPAGWIGPVALYEGAPGTEPSCPSGYPTVVSKGTAGVDAQPAMCSACTCGTPTVTCGQAAFDLLPSCSAQPVTTLMLDSASCTASPGTADRFLVHAPTPDVSCAPSGGTPTLPPVDWMTGGVACGAVVQPISCADGTACAPPPPAPFAQKWCILSMTAQACPSQFPDAHIWETASDGRDCAPCTCAGGGSPTCSALVGLHDDTTCTHVTATVSSNGQCVQKGSIKSFYLVTMAGGTPSCQAGGGTPTGMVTTTPAVSVCCQP